MALNRESIKRDYPWITNQFLQVILRNKFENSAIEVTEFDAVPATAPGENYATVVIRIQMSIKHFEKDSISTIVKLNHSRKDIAEIMSELDLNSRENHLYQVMLNQVHELLRTVGINVKLGPDLISCSSNPSYVMLEDLKPLGYKITDKYMGLDYEQLKMTLTKLAYWHAGTAVLGEKDPSMVEMHHECLHINTDSPFEEPIRKTYHRFGTEAEKWEGFKEIGQKFQKYSSNYNDIGSEIFPSIPDPDGFNVLNHGDMWLCNIMFKEDAITGKSEDVIMIDYSLSYWGKPGLDLSYFLFSSSTENVSEEDWDNLLMYYHSVLVSTLKKLNYRKEIPRFFDIYTNFLFVGQFTCGCTLEIASIRQLVDLSHAQLSNMLDDCPEADTFRETLATNPKFRVSAERLLKYFHRKGFLD